MKNARWTKDQRLEFIDFRLHWDGQLNRSDLIDFFGISVPQASVDIADYSKIASDNLVYDRQKKAYLRTEKFSPRYESSSPESYLSELLALKQAEDVLEHNFIKWMPACEVVPIPKRKVPSDILFVVLTAIRQNKVVEVTYLSKNRDQPTSRCLSPHAIAHDGIRWHVRAYCYTRKAYRDFVIARFIRAELSEEAGMASNNDNGWNKLLKLELVPNPDLPVSHQRVIELEYGMTDGMSEISCRQALLYYVKRRLGLEFSQAACSDDQQVVLKNYDELKCFID
ncbi:MAG: helix-turn-helix transcriptional regulator [bacterium]